MNHIDDIDRYLKDPSLVIDLCREVFDRLEAGTENDKTPAMEAQLREIARAIEKLDKQGVPIPEVLRAEKTRLAAALGVSAEGAQLLNHLTNELDELLKDFKSRLFHDSVEITTKKPRVKRSKSPKTDSKTLRQHIIEALQHFGGASHKNEILQYMEQKLQGKLLPGDMEWRASTNDYAWQNNACWERFRMTKDCVLKTGSPRGIWELSEGTSRDDL